MKLRIGRRLFWQARRAPACWQMWRWSLILLVGLVGSPAAMAVEPDEIMKDPKLEARARQISKGLRCLVCQNQSIDDSNAALARDLRRLVRQRLRQGDSNADVIRYIHARYGDFVLLKPPVRADTLILWFGPLAGFLLVGGLLLYRARRQRQTASDTPTPLSTVERDRLAQILNTDGEDPS